MDSEGQSSLFQTKFVNCKNIRPTKNPLLLQALISRGTHFIHGIAPQKSDVRK